MTQERSITKPEKSCLCPEIDPAEWEGRHVSFDQKRFLHRSIPLAFHLPIGLGEEVQKLQEKARKLDLALSRPHMMLQRNTGLFKGQLLFAIETDIGPEESTLLTGKYLAKVCRAPHEELGRKAKAFTRTIEKEQGIKPGELIYWYVNCPRCWSRHDGPVTILLARIGNPGL